jgi:hypothetical protein
MDRSSNNDASKLDRAVNAGHEIYGRIPAYRALKSIDCQTRGSAQGHWKRSISLEYLHKEKGWKL